MFQAWRGWIQAPQTIAVISGKRISEQEAMSETAAIATTKMPLRRIGSHLCLSVMLAMLSLAFLPVVCAKRHSRPYGAHLCG